MRDGNETRDDAPNLRTETRHGTETHHVHYDPETTSGVSETLVTAIADIADVDPLELEPLHETVDPDTLDDLVGSSGRPDSGGHVSFTFGGYDVAVHANGLIEIESGN